jgi:hypothetical protein
MSYFGLMEPIQGNIAANQTAVRNLPASPHKCGGIRTCFRPPVRVMLVIHACAVLNTIKPLQPSKELYLY